MLNESLRVLSETPRRKERAACWLTSLWWNIKAFGETEAPATGRASCLHVLTQPNAALVSLQTFDALKSLFLWFSLWTFNKSTNIFPVSRLTAWWQQQLELEDPWCWEHVCRAFSPNCRLIINHVSDLTWWHNLCGEEETNWNRTVCSRIRANLQEGKQDKTSMFQMFPCSN